MKAGKTPKEWQKNRAKNRQKDKDARWTKKHGKSFYGYKNHVNADAKHKLIRHYEVTDAASKPAPLSLEPTRYDRARSDLLRRPRCNCKIGRTISIECACSYDAAGRR